MNKRTAGELRRAAITTTRAMTRWLHAEPRHRHGSHLAWMLAESERRRRIDQLIPFNARRQAAAVVTA